MHTVTAPLKLRPYGAIQMCILLLLLLINLLSHLKCVITLPCKILMSEKPQQPETFTVINNISVGSVAT